MFLAYFSGKQDIPVRLVVVEIMVRFGCNDGIRFKIMTFVSMKTRSMVETLQ